MAPSVACVKRNRIGARINSSLAYTAQCQPESGESRATLLRGIAPGVKNVRQGSYT